MTSRDSSLFSGTDPLASAETEEGFRRELQLWRDGPLRGFNISMLGACVIAATWFHIIPYGLTTLEFWLGAVALAALLVVGKRLPFAVRSGAYLGIVFVVCTTSTLRIGISPNAMVGFSTIAVAATILFGVRVALGSVVVMVLAILAVCALHAAGWVEQAPNWVEILDGTRLVNGVRIASIFALLSSASAVGVAFLLKRSEDLAWQQAQVARALRSEQAETARLLRDLELQQAALHKARELETLGRLAGSMAHDFNNALLVIWGAIDELSHDEELSDTQAEALEALRIASEQATATTRSLRAFGPGTPRRPTTLQVAALITRAGATLSRVLPPNVRLQSEIRSEASIAADEGELLRVLTNLALNARDAMREGGTLTFRVRPADAREQIGSSEALVAIEVSDTGTGIPKDVQARLFEPYFTTKQTGGTGLGLASVREIVRAHDGEVQVSSEPGRGTTITLLWPVSASAKAAERADAPAPAPGGGRAILIVDDEAAVRATLARGLGRAGFQVVEAADAATALEALRRSKLQLDVLCTDWMMPGAPARQLIEEFRRVHGGAVLVCSGYAPAETSLTPEMVDDFLAKPFSGEELVRRIHHLLSERSASAGPQLPSFN